MDILTKHTTANNPVLKIVAGVLFILFPVIGFILGLQFQTLNKQTTRETVVLPTPTKFEIQTTPQPQSTVGETANWKTYTNGQYSYSFKYPENWVVLDKTPEKFRSKLSYVEGVNINDWLKSKMMFEKCRGPILQNTLDSNQLIAVEIVDKNDDGLFCWSIGYFFDNNKWKVADKYAYPIGTDNLHFPEWKGDYVKFNTVAENDKSKVFISLINYETYKLSGLKDLNIIISTFKFTQ